MADDTDNTDIPGSRVPIPGDSPELSLQLASQNNSLYHALDFAYKVPADAAAFAALPQYSPVGYAIGQYTVASKPCDPSQQIPQPSTSGCDNWYTEMVCNNGTMLYNDTCTTGDCSRYIVGITVMTNGPTGQGSWQWGWDTSNWTFQHSLKIKWDSTGNGVPNQTIFNGRIDEGATSGAFYGKVARHKIIGNYMSGNLNPGHCLAWNFRMYVLTPCLPPGDIKITSQMGVGSCCGGGSAPCDACKSVEKSCPTTITIINGCTDSTAANYNSSATVDDGSCCYVSGCTDSTANNYNSNACFDDGSCCYIGGCTDSTATNYNSLACLDDGSCVFPVSGCTDSTAFNYNSLATVDDGSCNYTAPSWNCGCGGSCSDPGTGLGTYSSLSACQASCNSNGNYINYVEVVGVCTPSLRGQFGSNCSCPDNQIQYLITGNWVNCPPSNTCPECFSEAYVHFEYESPINSGNWIIMTGSYETFGALGVGYDHMSGFNHFISRSCGGTQFWPGATNYRVVVEVRHEIPTFDYTFVGQPYYFVPPVWAADHCDCMDPIAINYNPNAQCDVGCIYPNFYEWKELDSSCTDLGTVNITELGANPTATNMATFYTNVFSPNVGQVIETSLGDCYEFLGTGTSISGTVHQVSSSGVITHNDCISCNAIYGCTDSTATNYNSNATIDDGSCTYVSLVCGCTDPTATNYNSSATGDCANPCNAIGGVTYNNISTYGDTSCCTYVSTVNGCTDPTACNYNSLATADDGSCCYSGCTDSLANNYNSAACCDDGSCITGPGNIYGCMDPLAINYSPLANIDDGTCIYNGNPPEPPVFNDNPCDTIDVTTITPNSCDLLQISHTWSNRVSTGTGECVDKLLDDLIMSVALYDMLNEKS